MKRVLVAYGSKMGGTTGIAEKIAETLSERGLDVTLQPAGEAKAKQGYDAAVVGSGLYAGRWVKHAVRLLKHLRRAGVSRVWLFHSGPLGDDMADEPQKAPGSVARLIEELGDDLPELPKFTEYMNEMIATIDPELVTITAERAFGL